MPDPAVRTDCLRSIIHVQRINLVGRAERQIQNAVTVDEYVVCRDIRGLHDGLANAQNAIVDPRKATVRVGARKRQRAGADLANVGD